MSQAIFYLQLAAIAIVLTGDKFFELLGIPPPEWYQKCKEAKFPVIIGIWFVGNLIQTNLSQTGAFEVFYNGQQASYSALL